MIIIYRGIRNADSTFDNDRRFINGQKSTHWFTRNRDKASRMYRLHNNRIGLWWYEVKEPR